jgi:hypothetical protein
VTHGVAMMVMMDRGASNIPLSVLGTARLATGLAASSHFERLRVGGLEMGDECVVRAETRGLASCR